MDSTEFPCPSCGFLMFSAPPGTYEICVLCNWEDDPVQLRFPSMGGGANKLSLAESQARALARFGVSVQTHGEFCRANGWRPLRPEELVGPSPSTGVEYFEASCEESVGYYWEVTSRAN